MNSFTHIKKLLLSLIVLGLAQALAAEVVVVVNAGNPESTISTDQLKDILTGKEKFWPDGSSIDLAVPSGSSIEAEVLSNFAGMDATRFKTHWRRLVFSGRAKDPSEFGDDAGMIAFVADRDGALGFVSTNADTGSVKVVTVAD